LAEARFHVANAEVFGAATGETHRAEAELDRADRYLQKAVRLLRITRCPPLKPLEKS